MTALYLDVKKDLLDKITSGEYSEGTIIPTEHELSDMYNVRRPTIRKAVQILVDAGYLEKKKKRGTLVCAPKVIQDFTQSISSFDTQMKRHGVVSKTHVIAFKTEEASKDVARSLNIHEEDLVYKLVRLRYTDKNPNVFITTYIPVSLFPDLLDTDFTHVRLYDVFEKQGHSIDTIDRQLEIIYKEISNTSRHQQIGMDPDNFIVMLTASITELVNRKMKDTIGFTSDFKASASILAQFIYINDFANAENAKVKMVDYLEHLNLLFASDLDFKAPIFLEDEFVPKDKFSEILGNYWISRMDIDFEWHVFFVMLFAIEPDSAINDFVNFISTIKQLLILPTWYQNKFSKYKEKEQIKEEIEALLANSLINVKKVKMIHEDYLYQMMDIFHSFVEKIETDYTSGEDILNDLDNIKKRFMYSVQRIVTK